MADRTRIPSSASRRALAAFAVTAALTAALSACSPGAGPTASSTPNRTATGSPTPRPSSSSTAVPIDDQCDTAKLNGSIAAGGGGAAGSVEVTLVLTNGGSEPCALQGWPGVSFVGDGNGVQLGQPAEFDRSAPHPTVRLAPGGTAHAPLKIAQALNYDQSECQPQKADGFRVYPPGSTTALFVKDGAFTACTSASVSLLTVGALVGG
ncbi:hypothetical protein O159_23220 [Leifsonia xyli subsp. cynodontis DSM 46306]|jgi:hypothetical protein|uniref:DUF4232 domain-containing protein n=1 Tax=Leifsonia xyli subsp. cynodontis DSM 46306 TaxID=1389489 RepID=U3PF58_LEIXC|nr:DUF4232 domain-containing protein [Leifsonia xyli]AGW42283.1 hypothetical protein O159_23220 [Leifsonia xyli subsp. cynodontis DSM 46306]